MSICTKFHQTIGIATAVLREQRDVRGLKKGKARRIE